MYFSKSKSNANSSRSSTSASFSSSSYFGVVAHAGFYFFPLAFGLADLCDPLDDFASPSLLRLSSVNFLLFGSG